MECGVGAEGRRDAPHSRCSGALPAAKPSFISRVLPPLGLCAAIVLNAAWIGFLGYWIFKLVI
jgi:hypothetical protein